MKRILTILFLVSGFAVLIQACKKEENPVINNTGVQADTPYNFVSPKYFPELPVPVNNPMTVRGIELGRMLFYDPILSRDSTISCASCHGLDNSFADNKIFSEGVDGTLGDRNSMAVINLGWQTRFFWNGRAHSLEEQALQPITNPVEMKETLPAVVEKLRRHPVYPAKFKSAFGSDQITPEMIAKAIAQFERTIVSYQSKFDKFYEIREPAFNLQEYSGFVIFSTERGQCFHCHGAEGSFLAHNLDTVFRNNGLLTDAQMKGKGVAEITNNPNDDGFFKVPTLRNVELTAPYMHDGRFATLEEVVEFYSSNIKQNRNLDINFTKEPDRLDQYGGLGFTSEEKADLVAFLKTFTDTSFINNPAYKNPFK